MLQEGDHVFPHPTRRLDAVMASAAVLVTMWHATGKDSAAPGDRTKRPRQPGRQDDILTRQPAPRALDLPVHDELESAWIAAGATEAPALARPQAKDWRGRRRPDEDVTT
jgi:hypothetical protein